MPGAGYIHLYFICKKCLVFTVFRVYISNTVYTNDFLSQFAVQCVFLQFLSVRTFSEVLLMWCYPLNRSCCLGVFCASIWLGPSLCITEDSLISGHVGSIFDCLHL